MIISKQGNKYEDQKGNIITDNTILEYIKKLVIPPNYKNTVIFYDAKKTPKILYQGYDSKNRLQRIYSQEWNKNAARRKYCELLNFAEQIENIKKATSRGLAIKEHTKEKMISMIIRLVLVCYFRIGNTRYQELYGSFGAINILKKHVVFVKDEKNKEYVHISFSGKKGVTNTCDVYDPPLIEELKKLLKIREKEQSVFLWNDGGVLTPISAIEVNAWLKEFDPVLTSKNFRTYESNTALIMILRNHKGPDMLTPTVRKKIIIGAVEAISKKLNNTPNILKKNYTQSGLINMFIKEPSKFMDYFENDKTPRVALVDYLKDYCRDN